MPTIPADQTDPKLVSVLEDAGCAALAEKFKGVAIESWVAAMEASRPAFLKSLQTSGVDKLSERQGIANKLGKAKREGRL